MIEHPTQLSSIVLQIADVCGIILMKRYDDDTDQQISNDLTDDPGESTMMSSDIEEDDLVIRQDVLHLD
jgi:hypothetical protein